MKYRYRKSCQITLKSLYVRVYINVYISYALYAHAANEEYIYI